MKLICSHSGTTSLDEVLEKVKQTKQVYKQQGKKTIYYYNIACAFDIETTSFYYNNNKCSVMYVWQLGIDNVCFTGRTFEEFREVLLYISNELLLCDEQRLLIYVHNLAFEFQFMCKYFNWNKVFCVKNRQPVCALTDLGIEFRCSYLLSGTSLERVGKNLRSHKVEKLVGNLDYTKIRHYKTPLTDGEWKYCLNDIKIVMSYIEEKMSEDGDIAKIPLTKTGYVRNYCREKCIRGRNGKQYKDLISTLTLCKDEYIMLKRAFMGGFTHANYKNAMKVHNDVLSADFTSSYPYVMIAEKFPMSKGRLVRPKNLNEFETLIKKYCCIFNVEFTDIEPKNDYDNPLSASKCTTLETPVLNNGRVMYAERVVTTITEVDYSVFKQFYNWSTIRIGDMWVYEKAYLPTNFVNAILKLYEDKTTLKGIKGKEVEYLLGKELLNSCYGMVVTDIVRDIIDFDEEWQETKADIDTEINRYNTDKKRFLFYPWGVYVTAYARRNLFTGILECKEDYIYSDTDSVKILNYEKHIQYFEWYNKVVIEKLTKAMKFHKLPIEKVCPKTVKGVVKWLGVWDLEDGFYTRFKTLGAKRYMVEDSDGINITVSGVNKKFAVPYLLDKYDDPFSAFDDGLKIPYEYYNRNGELKNGTGKMTHTYIDDEMCGVITDYLGNSTEFVTKSGVHLEGADFKISISDVYINLIKGVTKI